MPQEALDPKSIYQDHVDSLTAALLSKDVEGFVARMGCPHTMIIDERIIVTERPENHRAQLLEYMETIRFQQVTEFIRLCTGAEFVTADRIEGTHTSYMMSGGITLNKPYENRVRLERINGIWIETACVNGISRPGGIMSLPIVGDDTVLAPLPNREFQRNKEYD